MPKNEPSKPSEQRHPPPAEDKEYLSGREEDEVDQASEDSFPASDPPSHTPITHSGTPKKKGN